MTEKKVNQILPPDQMRRQFEYIEKMRLYKVRNI